MKRSFSLFFLVLVLMMTKAASATTWYVRADGGTRYSSNASEGQCDGQADAAYSGKGVNQHCAFNDYRFLWDDQHTYGVSKWVINGGDTVILDNTKQWRVGFDQGDSSSDVWCVGGNGTFACLNPTVPAGTAQQHTRILGRNYASCSAGNQPDPKKMTQIFGGYGVYDTLNLDGAQYVDVQCLEVTSHSACTIHGSPVYPKDCQRYSAPIDDFDSDGISTDTATHDILLQDLWIHGHTDRGIKGPIGGLITANRVDISTNGMAGWDFDPGDGTQSPNGLLKMSYSTIEFSGCNQVYPNVLPVACYSQSSGGYGDGIGTPISPMAGVYIDHSIFRYNTQDGEDFGHVSMASNLSITNSASYGNSGGQFKWAGFQNVVFENNIAVANCLRMSQPIAGIPSTYNKYLSDFCRAGDALSFDFNNNATAIMADNTIVTYAPTTFDFQCYDTASCANTTLTMNNNIVYGLDNPSTYNYGGQNGGVGGFCGQGCNSSTQPLGRINRSNNIFYGIRGSCIANQPQYAAGTATGESCLDPQFESEPTKFTAESVLDSFDFTLASNSPAKGGGISVSGLTLDYLGASRTSPTTIGALAYASQLNLNDLTSWLTTGVTAPTPPSNPVTPTPPTPAPPTTPTPPTAPAPPTAPNPPSPPTRKTPFPTTTVLSVAEGSGSAILTARVTPRGILSGQVKGTVVLYNGARTAIAKGQLKGNGTVSWAIPSELNGQEVFAAYQGNGAYLRSTSTTLGLTQALASLK